MHKIIVISVFFGFTVPFIFLTPYFDFYLVLLLILVSGCICYSILLGTFIYPNIKTREYTYISPPSILLVSIFIIYVVMRVDLVVGFYSALINGSVLSFVMEQTQDRYGRTSGPGLVFQLGTISFFIFCGLFGRFSAVNKVKKIYMLLILFFIAGIEMSQSGRAGFIMGGAFLCSQYIISNKFNFNKLSYSKVITVVSLLLLFLLMLLAVVQFSRISHRSDAIYIVLSKLPGYTIRPHASLAQWLLDNKSFDYLLGFNTFGAIGKHLGLLPNIDGFYLQVTSPIGTTNIFTVLRSTLNDFGFLGFSILSFYLGLLMYKWSYVRINYFQYVASSVILLLFLFPFISVFSYTTFLISFAVVMSILYRYRKINYSSP